MCQKAVFNLLDGEQILDIEDKHEEADMINMACLQFYAYCFGILIPFN